MKANMSVSGHIPSKLINSRIIYRWTPVWNKAGVAPENLWRQRLHHHSISCGVTPTLSLVVYMAKSLVVLA